MATTIEDGRTAHAWKKRQGGFTLIEVMVSMVILAVGLVTLLGVFGLAMATTQTTQQDLIAKQLANEALESIVTARNTGQITWDQIQNVGTGNGIFVTNLQPINLAGPDGIIGTADDGPAQVLTEPGPDGIYGTADDVQVPLTNYQRAIAIGQEAASLRSINITIQYSTPRTRFQKTYVLNSYISQFR